MWLCSGSLLPWVDPLDLEVHFSSFRVHSSFVCRVARSNSRRKTQLGVKTYQTRELGVSLRVCVCVCVLCAFVYCVRVCVPDSVSANTERAGVDLSIKQIYLKHGY